MTDAEVAGALPALARLGVSLCLALPSDRVGEDAFASLTRRAADHGVSVRLWPLLPRVRGYWVGETNVDDAAELLDAITRWRGLAVDGVSVDLEPAYAYSEALRAAQKTSPAGFVALLRSHVDAAAFARARDTLARAVDHARRAGLVLHAVTYPLVLDQPDGTPAIEDAFDIPVNGIAWDEVSFMVYQTAFAQQVGEWLGPALVHSYARTAVARFGDRAGLDLGVVGDAGVGLDPGDRYPDPGPLRADVGAALDAGIPLSRLRVYGLRGAIHAGGAPHWLALDTVTPRAPAPSRMVDGLRNAVRLLANLL